MEQVQLDRTARAANTAVEQILITQDHVEGGEMLQAVEHLNRANDAAQQVRKALFDAGGRPPEVPSPPPVPLHLLSTAAGRRLLTALRDAQEAAEAVDAERGNVLPADFPLQPGEARGTGWAETISNLTERLRQEVEGPRGRE